MTPADSPDRDAIRRRRTVAMAGHGGDFAIASAALEDADPTVRAAALGALARIGRLGVDTVVDATHDSSPTVRARAADLCAALAGSGLGPREVLAPSLASLLGDPDAAVVEAACTAIGEMGEAASAGAVIDAVAHVAATHGDPLCRESAVAALGAIGADRGLQAVLAGLQDRPAIRRRAVIALASFEGPEVDEALEEARRDRDWQVRQAAEDLLTS